MAGKKNRVLTDRAEIREWAESRGASPACVRGTGSSDDVGVLRLDFPGYSGETSLQHIDWDEWLDKFDENGLALIVEDTTANGEKSNFNKIVSRAEVKKTAAKKTSSARHTARGKSASKKTAGRKVAGRKAAARTSGRKSAKRARGRAR